MSNKDLKILFLSASNNRNTGSYRIWIEDYCAYLRNVGVDARIGFLGSLSWDDMEQFDVFVLGKLDQAVYEPLFRQIREHYPTRVIGAITPPSNLTTVPFDFVMTGSMEEADSLAFHKNVIVNAHIESLYYGSVPKEHSHRDTLKICVHGWSAHLASLEPHLARALEEFEQEQDLELVVICESDNFEWTTGRPNIKNITMKKWDIETVKKNIQECDIGLVPGLHDLTPLRIDSDPKNGLFETDYVMRFKNKTNNGRALVFFYLGIPVIADFSPSHLHILGGADSGFIAHTKEGWLRALRILKNDNMRTAVSRNAHKRACDDYNPQHWARRYYDSIKAIYHQKLIEERER